MAFLEKLNFTFPVEDIATFLCSLLFLHFEAKTLDLTRLYDLESQYMCITYELVVECLIFSWITTYLYKIDDHFFFRICIFIEHDVIA